MTSGMVTRNLYTSSLCHDKRENTASVFSSEQQERHLNKAKNKIMRKLSLSMEQQSKLLALNYGGLDGTRAEQEGRGIPEQKMAYFDRYRYENIPKQSSCRPSKFSDNGLPTLSPEHKLSRNVDNCPKEYTVNRPKSPLRLITNAIKRAIRESLASPPEGLNNGQDTAAKLPSENTLFNFPHTLADSACLRNSRDHGEYDIQRQGSNVLCHAGKGLEIRRSHASNFSSSPKEKHPCEDTSTSFPLYSMHTSLSKSPCPSHHSHPYTNMDDVPKLLERFTLTEDLRKSTKDYLAFPNQNIRYSSLRLRNKNTDAILESPLQRNNIWNLFKENVDGGSKNSSLMAPLTPSTIFSVDDVVKNSCDGEYLGKQSTPFYIL